MSLPSDTAIVAPFAIAPRKRPEKRRKQLSVFAEKLGLAVLLVVLVITTGAAMPRD